ncbi:oleosin Ara h 15.0101-like [Argentina anserina]|uniref:oleosin Ara h 15.0101-like n=1 Tax=Argentina anserina TaxID=57926 RepID=UPI0021768B98|nr:oleosin Ara h 15.0101-like [Potentilla anserina]
MINTAPFASSKKPDEPVASRDRTSTAKVLTTRAVGATFLVLSVLALTGSVMVLIFASPVVVLFSPILVPVGIVLFLAASGLIFSGGCGVAGITALSWLYRYASDYLAAKRRAQAYGASFAQIGL